MPSLVRPLRRWLIGVIPGAALLAAGVASLVRQPPDPDRLWQKAEAALQAGHWDQARADLRRIEQLRAKTPLDWLLQAQLASAEGQTDAALAALRHVPDDHRLACQAHYMAGRLERGRNRIRRAEAAFRRALELDPNFIPAHKELIYIYGMQLRRREADAEFRTLAHLTPLNHHDLFTWALTHDANWRTDIIKDLRRFLAADPDDRFSRLALAQLLLKQPESEIQVEQVLEPLPLSDPDALVLRVRLAIQRGRWEEAAALLNRGPADHSGLARLRGQMALRHRDIARAITHFREALCLEPYDRVANFDLGQALLVAGQTAEAEVYLARARRLNEVYNLINKVRSPERENAPSDLTQLGLACEAAGLFDEARGWYGLAIGRDPLDTEAQKGLFRLQNTRKDDGGQGDSPH
jgi:tetratricopeptide (TPR) repeat protein